MNTRKFFIILLISLSLIGSLLSSCNFNKIKVGDVRMMYGSNEDGHIAYTFSTFSGFERGNVEASEGQTINFSYNVNIDHGILNIEWQDPDGALIWQKSFQEGDTGLADIAVESSGLYNIIIQGKNSAGDFDVSWKVE